MTQPMSDVDITRSPFRQIESEFDVCVVGGGMAGLCAAIASARHGARTVLVQDRPVLGGNASSEIRMWICGAHGRNVKETGILEEIQLENCYRNSGLNYSVWDSVLYEKAFYCPNLTLMLNTTCCGGQRQGDKLASITAWQLTSQTWHTIHARVFIDCSGDSVLAPISGADTRWGREARSEFDEDIQPAQADRKTMGNTLLLQLREVDEPVAFTPPVWAYRFRSPADLPHRGVESGGSNFWWLELGGLADTVHDAPRIAHELMKIGYGVWDYMKNHMPTRDRMAHWTLEWMGSLPGKRENRRYIGLHTLTQNDIRDGGRFSDIIAYGGWSMDDHHPAGLIYPGKPTIFHPAPSPYGIPYRSLVSRNVTNLLCAGRNISTTHAALSSTRVMATCSLIGQAAGTAAALCVQHQFDPAELYPGRVGELQQQLMEDDLWLPGLERAPHALTQSATLSVQGDGTDMLRGGHDRPLSQDQRCWSGPLGQPIETHLVRSQTDRQPAAGGRQQSEPRQAHALQLPAQGQPLRGSPDDASQSSGAGSSWPILGDDRPVGQQLSTLDSTARAGTHRWIAHHSPGELGQCGGQPHEH
ncbi:MAG: FAD-dependent oxidoreductase [Phycisphaerales bacterium]|nr:FAD-dependent oxidoreductase [Phycisphaerales bacterium]